MTFVARSALALAALSLLLACSKSGREAAINISRKPSVYVVNYPLQYFAERIGGDLVEVHFPAPSDEDPAYWEPGAATIQAYQQADLILLNGAGYARWVSQATLPESRLVDTSAGFRDQYIELTDLVTHSHGPGGEHAHGGTAFTTWLDPLLARRQAEAAAEALVKLLPDQEGALRQNLEALAADLDALGQLLKQSAAGHSETPLLASHPVYQYLARAASLNLKSLHWEPNGMPPANEWRKLDRLLKEHPAKWMIWEAPPAAEIAAKLAKRGISSSVFYTCGNVPESGDYLSVMHQNVERLRLLF